MNHQAKKKYGQNFLRDKNLLLKIVRESKIEDRCVIEVGPGQGALTSFLAERAREVMAYEIDPSLAPYLNPIVAKYPHVTILYEDFLEADLSILNKEYHVVANVPYYITTPIIFKLLENTHIKTASLMIQKEVCDRLVATPESKDYNALSVILQYHAHVYKLMDVKRHLFYPVPHVDSAVIRIEKRGKPLLNSLDEKRFLTFVKHAFKQKRKTLINNLHEGYQTPKDEIIEYLSRLNYASDIRAEKLSLDDFIKLAKEWSYD